jgi:hypothetical protein
MEQQKQQRATEIAPHWPWNDEDLAPLADDASSWPLPWWHRIRPLAVAVCLAGVAVFLLLTVVGWRIVYQHHLDDQAQWIVQQNQAQISCLHHAHSAQAQAACAHALASAVTAREADFARQDVAPGYANAATEMQGALDALYASACYDPTSGAVDQTCLQHMAPSLRMLAVLDAAAAQQTS